MIRQFLRFGMVGVGGLFVDTAILYAALACGSGFYLGRLISYLGAATFTWVMNRRFTFREHADPNRLREWARFLAANAVGGVLNYCTYALLIGASGTVRALPVLGVAAGSIAGLAVNFILSRQMVFKQRRPQI